MGFDLLKSLKDGLSDTFSLKGSYLVAAFFASYGLMEVVFRSLMVSGYSSNSWRIIDASSTYILPEGVLAEGLASLFGSHLGLLTAAFFFLPLIPTVMAFRGFTGAKLVGSFREFFRSIFFLLLANLIAMLGIFFGSIFLFLPGVYIAISVVFFPVLVCAEGRGLESLKESWKLSRNNEIKILGLLLVLGIVTFVPGLAADHYGLGMTSVLFSSVSSVFGIATISSAYRQIKGDRDER